MRSICPTAVALAAVSIAVLAPTAAATVPCAEDGIVVTQCHRWEARYTDEANAGDTAYDVAASPDGSTVYVTGISYGAESGTPDVVTVAHDADTGDRLWVARYDGQRDAGAAVTATADGVFVTGTTGPTAEDSDILTVAYDPESGAELWSVTAGGPGAAESAAIAVGPRSPGPNGEPRDDLVYVAGQRGDSGTVIAYDTATGQTVWSLSSRDEAAVALDLLPAGSVVVTGTVGGEGAGDIVTRVLDIEDGSARWTATYEGAAGLHDTAADVAVSPDGSRIVVAGTEGIAANDTDMVTLGYAPDGTLAWSAAYGGVPPPQDFFSNEYDAAAAVRISPDGSRAFVTGAARAEAGTDYLTVAYDAATGDEVWAESYDGPQGRFDTPHDLGVSPDGSRVYVTGNSSNLGIGISAFGGSQTLGYAFDDYATVAYDATDGTPAWVGRYDGPNGYTDIAYGLAVAPTGHVFVTGRADVSRHPPAADPAKGPSTGFDYVTLSYEG